MKDNQNFETYLFLSSKKLIISVNQKKDFKRIYYKEMYSLYYRLQTSLISFN